MPDQSLANSRLRSYSLYGLTLESDFSFATYMKEGKGAPDLTFRCVLVPPVEEARFQASPAYASPLKLESDESLIYIYRQSGYDILRISEVADFYIWDDKILCHLIDPNYYFAIEIWLIGTVMSYWLERQSIPALHAAAVEVGGKAIGFLSSNKGGKTSLAASFMQAGHPLLTDDILPLEQRDGVIMGRPGYPQMRMWPDQAERFLGNIDRLEPVHPHLDKRRIPVGSGGLGLFCNSAKPLACLFLPERREGGDIEIVPLPLGKAVFELVRHSFIVGMVEALGWQAKRFMFFSQLVKQVPVFRLAYPSGVEHLPRVRQALIEQLRAQVEPNAS